MLAVLNCFLRQAIERISPSTSILRSHNLDPTGGEYSQGRLTLVTYGVCHEGSQRS